MSPTGKHDLTEVCELHTAGEAGKRGAGGRAGSIGGVTRLA